MSLSYLIPLALVGVIAILYPWVAPPLVAAWKLDRADSPDSLVLGGEGWPGALPKEDA